MAKKNYNYGIVRSIFGDYWVGKTFLPEKEGSIFAKFGEAKIKALRLANSDDNIQDLEDTVESECEQITKALEKFII